MNHRHQSGLPLILLGAGSHGKVLLAMTRAVGLNLNGVCDPKLAKEGVTNWQGVPVLGGDEALNSFVPTDVELILGVGQLVGQNIRMMLFEKLKAQGFSFKTLVHPTAWIDPTARLGEGVQIMAGAIVQTDSLIEDNAIINTRASIDHDCKIGRHVHIAPGANICGGVEVRNEVFVGSGATIIQYLQLGECSVLGAGATLLRNLPPHSMAIGVPARIVKTPTW